MPITFLQYSHCTFVIILFGPFSRLFIDLTMCERALLPKPTTTLGLVEQTFWRVPFFTEWSGASSFQVNLAWQSRHSTTGTFSSGTSGSRWLSIILPHERIRRRIRLCRFFHAYSYRGGNCNCLLSHTARWFSHCQQSPRILCTRCFVPWFLTTAFFSKFPILAQKFLFRISCSILLFTIVFNLWQSGPNFFW